VRRGLQLDLEEPCEASFVVKIPQFRKTRSKCHRGDEFSISVVVSAVKFTVCVFPRGRTHEAGDSEDMVRITVFSSKSMMCGLDLTVFCADRKLSHTIHAERFEEKDGYGWGDSFAFAELDKDFLDDDTFRLRVSTNFSLSSQSQTHPVGLRYREEVEPAFDLSGDMERLFQELDSGPDPPSFADVVLEVDGVSLHAHRSVLSARSPVFRAAFSSDMQEGRKHHMKIEDVDVTTMKRFLEFLYTGNIGLQRLDLYGRLCKRIRLQELDFDAVGAIMKVADKYELQSLTDYCVRSLCKRTTLKSVLKILKIAYDRENKILKERSLEFVAKDKSTIAAVMDLPEFDNLGQNITRDLFIHSHGCGKRKRQEEKEFCDGSDWSRLTFAQLQRACDERELSTMGSKEDMVRRLQAETQA
jgi:hypothetical protein